MEDKVDPNFYTNRRNQILRNIEENSKDSDSIIQENNDIIQENTGVKEEIITDDGDYKTQIINKKKKLDELSQLLKHQYEIKLSIKAEMIIIKNEIHELIKLLSVE